MNEKVFKAINERCKDMGLTSKAIKEYAERASEGLAEDATDEDIETVVDSVVAFAKITQGEITRKTRRQQTQANKPNEGEDEGANLQATVKAMLEKELSGVNAKITALKTENEQLKAEKAKSERNAVIAEKAKELGIPQFLVKHLAIADDADIEKALGEIKQDLVNGSLMPKEAANETGAKPNEQMKADAKAWAENLPNM